SMIESVRPGEITSEILNLSELEIRECTHCNFCLTGQEEGRYCSILDDAQAVFEKVERADIVILASPVYFMRTSAMMAAFIDRLRVFVFGNLARSRLRNKVGVSAAVSWMRNGGLETTHLTHLYAFMTLEMIPVGLHGGTCPLGASGVSGTRGALGREGGRAQGVELDEAGLESAARVMARAIELARMVRKDGSP
ncbi:MAG TPA: flavodoxin family protein, partial [Deltaproteobacteria bacterium]|nr:flavodoxin family protein [Deltaproteobacteria bacterium]